MPRPPAPNTFTQINFVVNYALMGCAPPFFLFIELAREPIKDLFLLFFLPDLEDIAQEIFQPSKGRRRNPARHGRKKGRGRGFPDPSVMIGQRARAFLNPFDAIKYSPVKYVFPILNAIEAVNFTAAVGEGLGDVFYEGILGVLRLNPENCEDFDLIERKSEFQPAQGGAGPPIDTFPLPQLVVNRGFFDSPFSTGRIGGPYTANISATVRPRIIQPENRVSLALGPDAGTIKAQSSVLSFVGQEWKTLDCTADFAIGEPCVWGLGERFGFYEIREASFLAYSTDNFPWPW